MTRPRTAATIRRIARASATVLFFAGFGALLFVVGAYIHALGSLPLDHLGAVFRVSGLFAVLGALFGTIVALDRTVDLPVPRVLRRIQAPYTRTLVCAALGAVAVLVFRPLVEPQFPASWAFLGGIAGAVLGWYGWRWARYVDF
jgi:hypothetical protein